MLDPKLYNNLMLCSSLEMENEGIISLATIDVGGVSHKVLGVDSRIQALVFISTCICLWLWGYVGEECVWLS